MKSPTCWFDKFYQQQNDVSEQRKSVDSVKNGWILVIGSWYIDTIHCLGISTGEIMIPRCLKTKIMSSRLSTLDGKEVLMYIHIPPQSQLMQGLEYIE